jgi:hypothetical protein
MIDSDQGEGREGVETAIQRAAPSVMRASRGVRRSNCKQIWICVHDPSEGMPKLLLYKILLIVLFVETPRKFITAKLSIRKPGSSSVLINM